MKKTVSSRLVGRIAAALAVAIAPAPALAQAVAVQPSSVSQAKTEAILGAPSRLAAILAVQQGVPAPKPLRPAAYSVRTSSYALLQEASRYSPGVTSGRPDVFGSVALAVGRTSLDRRWRAVARRPVGGIAAAYSASLRGHSDLAKAEAVNRYVNQRVQFIDDSRQYGREDLWSAANDTLRRGRGDCEDYAIAKLQMLRAAGFSDRDLYLVVAKDLVRRSDHALLVVRAGGRMLVLDNGTDAILDADRPGDYRPVLTFAASGSWTHGYRRAMPTVAVAASTIAPLTPSGPRRRP
ncbi:transglutaminase-like cysteine peptidase [Sphingomonas sp.]|uniref:transglutaminase-like cysteine peptidase n=1 Tax=Sphingomonas sp. TaxID=28214 RepID=UPI00178E7C74|nr:transglutaminase-like cysteine peptidase [Sphingomonas sp.]MBA3511974.1 transglutaminase-like cysteine peptidase [Sphingomonas sp.]